MSDDTCAGGNDREWPKPWGEIFPEPDNDGAVITRLGPQFVDFGTLRDFDGTLYINADAGSETGENRDLWMPLDHYITDSEHGGDAGDE